MGLLFLAGIGQIGNDVKVKSVEKGVKKQPTPVTDRDRRGERSTKREM